MSRKPDLRAALSAVPARVERALLASHQALAAAGVPHALAGGIAVGAYGYARSTKDVDWLVGDKAFRFHGKLVTMRAGIPYEYDGVSIDYLSPSAEGEAAAMSIRDVAVVPVENLFRMKLEAARARDLSDLVELVKRGVDLGEVRRFVRRAAPHLLPTLARVERAAAEEED